MVELVNVRVDHRTNGVFSKDEWTSVRKAYYRRFQMKHTKKAFKNKMNNLKERFKDFKKLVENNTGLGWNPILKTVDATPDWWENYLKSNPRMKRFRTQGCPEYEKLGIIFGDTIATGHLQASQDHGFDSSGEEDDDDDGGGGDDLNGNVPVTPCGSRNSTRNNDQDEGEQSRPNKRSRVATCSSRSRSKSSELSDAIKMFAESSQSRNEMRKKFSIQECMEILDKMEEEIAEAVYMRAIKLLQEKGWRESFMVMSSDRRKSWLKSIERGVL